MAPAERGSLALKAIVTAPICPLFSAPDHGSPLADEALYGHTVEALEPAGPDYWHVRTAYRYEGYAPAACLCLDHAWAEDWAARPKRVVWSKHTADVLAQPAYRARTLLTLPLGARGALLEEGAEWSRGALPDGSEGYVRAGALGPCYETPPDLPESELRERLTETALVYRGSQYRWGGKTPLGVDCSGLVSMAYLLNGVTIHRDAELREGFDLVAIRAEELAPGDAIFFPGHVALYLGDGRYVHSTGKAGSDGVTINSLDPHAPDYRPDLAQSILQIGSYRGFHGK